MQLLAVIYLKKQQYLISICSYFEKHRIAAILKTLIINDGYVLRQVCENIITNFIDLLHVKFCVVFIHY